MSTARKLVTESVCDPATRASCMGRMAALEEAVARLESKILGLVSDVRDATTASREATAESHSRNEALDDLARKLLVKDNGIKLLKDTGEHPAIPEPPK